jgi:hypothetical protein
MVQVLTIDRGDRRPVDFTIDRTSEEPTTAGPLEFSHNGVDWVAVDPLDEDADPAVYRQTYAYGDEADFADAHGEDVIPLSGSVTVLVRLPDGTGNVDTEPVAFLVTNG